jgi:hypothetical protein
MNESKQIYIHQSKRIDGQTEAQGGILNQSKKPSLGRVFLRILGLSSKEKKTNQGEAMTTILPIIYLC